MRGNYITAPQLQRPCRHLHCIRERPAGESWWCAQHIIERRGCRFCGSLDLAPTVSKNARRRPENHGRYCARTLCVLRQRHVFWVEHDQAGRVARVWCLSMLEAFVFAFAVAGNREGAVCS